MFNLNLVRKLARSNKWKSLYAHAKKMGGLCLFNNSSDITQIQMIFLHWLEINDFLEKELAQGAHYLSKDIINNDIRVDAYLLMRNKEKNVSKDKKEKEVNNNSGLPSVSFRR